jgi:methylase of polypeptide subunit release factors
MRFGPLDLRFDERVLRPRLWTLGQAVWGAALVASRPQGPVLELCAGAGQIGIALGMLADRDLVLVDMDDVACSFAQWNAAASGHGDRVDVRPGRMAEAVAAGERFELILADPPYVPSKETSRFPADPLPAIDGGDDGLDLAGQCVHLISSHLAPGGEALLQLRDPMQADVMTGYLSERPSLGLQPRQRWVLEQGTLLRLGSGRRV